MAYKLGGKPRLHTIDIGGVLFECITASQSMRDQAMHISKQRIRLLMESDEIRASYGLEQDHVDVMYQDADVMLGVSGLIYAVELALLVVKSWSGVEDENGNSPAALTRRNLSLLLNEVVPSSRGETFATTFTARVHALVNLVLEEGNG